MGNNPQDNKGYTMNCCACRYGIMNGMRGVICKLMPEPKDKKDDDWCGQFEKEN